MLRDNHPEVVPNRVAGQGTYLRGRSFPCHAQPDFLLVPGASEQPSPNPLVEPGQQPIIQQLSYGDTLRS